MNNTTSTNTYDEDELRDLVDAELGGFVLWTDDTPHSDEPTELAYFIKGFENGHEIWHRFVTEAVELIASREQSIKEQAKNQERLMIHSRLISEMLFLRIAINRIRDENPNNLAPEAFDKLFKIVSELWESIDQSKFKRPALHSTNNSLEEK